MAIWNRDKELYEIAKKELFPALVGDILDKMGYRHQFLPPYIKPLADHMVVIGRAMTVLEADVFVESDNQNFIMEKPFGIMFEALDSLQEDEVYICTGSSHSYALWGGLMSTRAQYLKCAGAVLDGYSRDTKEILSLDFPTFSAGTYAQDQGVRGKVIAYRVPIEVGRVRVNSGDIIFGDRDGVLVVPAAAVEEAFTGAIEKARGESMVKKLLLEGKSTRWVFDETGIM